MKLSLRFDAAEIPAWAARYPSAGDATVENIVAPAARKQRFLTKEQFLELAKWKSPRSQRRCDRNDAPYVEEVTRQALQSKNERFKIESLRLLDGVDWPTASVILHLCDEQPYPILDFRALWSLGVAAPPPYDFPFWSEYSIFTRALALKAIVSMRALDRALWQYSRERQRS
jgi:hypothetical protein